MLEINKFSANIGFLWPELSFLERLRAAAEAKFRYVECHFPYDTPAADVAQALKEYNLTMMSLNTRLGFNGPDDFGVAARPGREEEAQGYIDEAIAYANTIGCKNVNVVPGKTGRLKGCEETFQQNLTLACEKASAKNMNIFVEPINQRSAPNFHCSTMNEVLDTLKAVNKPNLKILFDCFHLQITGGDLLHQFVQAKDHIGHIQFSAVHDRGEPDSGEINYPWLLNEYVTLGWSGCFGAEYQPRTNTAAGLGWLDAYRTAGHA